MRFEYFDNDRTGTRYIRVSKKIAQKAFNSGTCVLIAPVNVNPHFWHGALIHYCNIDYDDIFGVANQFERVCNSIIFYNCSTELGHYLKYFLPQSLAIKYGYRL